MKWSAAEVAEVPPTGVVSGSHVDQPNHTYTVTVTVFDSDGEQGSGSFQVTVGAPTVTVAAGDNGSSDGSGEWVRANYPEVRVLTLTSPTAFSDSAAN